MVIVSSSLFLTFDSCFLSLASPSLGNVLDQLVGLQDCGPILWAYLLPLAQWRVLIFLLLSFFLWWWGEAFVFPHFFLMRGSKRGRIDGGFLADLWSLRCVIH